MHRFYCFAFLVWVGVGVRQCVSEHLSGNMSRGLNDVAATRSIVGCRCRWTLLYSCTCHWWRIEISVRVLRLGCLLLFFIMLAIIPLIPPMSCSFKGRFLRASVNTSLAAGTGALVEGLARLAGGLVTLLTGLVALAAGLLALAGGFVALAGGFIALAGGFAYGFEVCLDVFDWRLESSSSPWSGAESDCFFFLIPIVSFSYWLKRTFAVDEIECSRSCPGTAWMCILICTRGNSPVSRRVQLKWKNWTQLEGRHDICSRLGSIN